MTKIYYAIIHKDGDSCYGVTFPDCPGCTAAGDTVEAASRDAGEALRLWIEAEESAGRGAPAPRDLDTLMADTAVAREAEGKVMIGITLLADAARSVRINISLDAGLLEAIDEAAKARGLTRSSFLAGAARDKILG